MGRKTKEIPYYELRRMNKRGYSVSRMATSLGVSVSKIYSELERTGLRPGPKTVDTTKALCDKCKYRGNLSGNHTRCCNYILARKECRGCKPRHCFRFEEGDKLIIEEE